MCGRFTQCALSDDIKRRFNLSEIDWEVIPRYNIAPGQNVDVIVMDGVRTLRKMRWGMVPSWAGDKKADYRMINARAETLARKPAFRHSFHNRRCLVPSDGFYEWKRDESENIKIPHRFTLRNEGLFAFAGLWDAWGKDEGSMLHTFTIITTAANDTVRQIHDRMPVVLDPEHESEWLDPASTVEVLSPLLKPYPSEKISFYEVSRAVNHYANDGPECIEPV